MIHCSLQASTVVFVYGKKSFPSKESDTKILQSIYFAYDVGMFKVVQFW